MRRRQRGVVTAAVVGASFVIAQRTASSLAAPPITGTGKRALPPPVVRDRHTGKRAELSLIQVQVAFRHGARTPMEDAAAMSDDVRWLPSDTDKAELLSGCRRIHLFPPGCGDGLEPADVFKAGSGSAVPLHGGGAPGQLTRTGLKQAVAGRQNNLQPPQSLGLPSHGPLLYTLKVALSIMQAVALGSDLRARYVDTDADSASAVRGLRP